ncbi:DUF3293 domain-containing protein [Streptomyces sp. SID4985]|uniref:DUF3293 domain-containing protein n=1 Tax=Streptomyces sp. SID4985 TaxID=2690292 RepID=UPI00136D0E2A|nr:DUF3293 domain-containing protein [Streptomyces sp. SID4985]
MVDIRFGERNVVRVLPCATGVTEGPYPDQSGRTIHVITAFNPRGRVVTPEDNARAHASLLAELGRSRHTWWPATGGSPCGTHTEESVAVTGLTDAEARALGRRFGQDAVFAWSPEAWRLLACFEERSEAAGWRTTSAPGGNPAPGASPASAENPASGDSPAQR